MSTIRPPKKPATAPVTAPRSRAIESSDEQEHVGSAAGDVERGYERHLQECSDEDDGGEGEAVGHYGSSGRAGGETRTITESSAEKSTSDTTSTCQ